MFTKQSSSFYKNILSTSTFGTNGLMGCAINYQSSINSSKSRLSVVVSMTSKFFGGLLPTSVLI